jgi:hypothetical protein
MTPFFPATSDSKTVTYGKLSFDLPILYFRDDAFALFFTADRNEVTSFMPSHRLHPVLLSARKAMVGIAAFNYIDTTIGPYGEVAVVLPAVYNASPPPVLIPALLESRYPDFGMLVMHLPVTNTLARDAGRQEWGYTKFVADMHFTITPEFMECRLSEKDQHILTLRVGRRGVAMRDKKPLVTFSVKEGNLLKTTIPQRCTTRSAIKPKDSFLQLGDHPVSETIHALGLSERPFMSRYYLERSGILPAGRIIQRGVKPLEGYTNKRRKGKHSVVYTAEEA